MVTLAKIVRTIGRIWIWLAVSWIIVAYFLNLIFSNEPVIHRIIVFINVWNVFVAFLIILPGYFLLEASEKIANRYGISFEKAEDNLPSKKIELFAIFFGSKIFLFLVIVGYLIITVLFVKYQNG